MPRGLLQYNLFHLKGDHLPSIFIGGIFLCMAPLIDELLAVWKKFCQQITDRSMVKVFCADADSGKAGGVKRWQDQQALYS